MQREGSAEIAIDVTRLVVRALRGRLPTGVDRVCLRYIRHFPDARAVFYKWGIGRVVSRAGSRVLFGLLLARPDHVVARLSRCLVRELAGRLPRRLQPGSLFLNVGHSGLELPGYGNWLRSQGLKPIFMVHDLIPITHPEYCRLGEYGRHGKRITTMLKHGAALIANSNATLAALESFACTRGTPTPLSVVAPRAGAGLPTGAAQPPLDEPYFVMLGTIEPRKNHALILQVWRRLAERWSSVRGPLPRLVIVGQRGWDVAHVESLIERNPVLRPLIIEIPDCDDAGMATWLRHARALLFPSFTEGFGLPLVEALAIGTPVIASDIAVFREIAGDVPLYVDPLDALGWLEAVSDFATDESGRRAAQLVRAGEFSPPSWDQHFSKIDRLLEQLTGVTHG